MDKRSTATLSVSVAVVLPSSTYCKRNEYIAEVKRAFFDQGPGTARREHMEKTGEYVSKRKFDREQRQQRETNIWTDESASSHEYQHGGLNAPKQASSI